MKRALAVLFGATVLTFAGNAAAQFPRSGTVSFGADRLMGVYFAGRSDFDWRLLGLGAPPGGTLAALPRFSVDGFVTDGLSLGGSLAIWSTEWNAGWARGSSDSVMIAPRVGYAIDFNDTFGFWPRGGPVILTDNIGGDDLYLTFEAAFYAMAGRSWGFTFGPTVDLGLDGPGRNREKTLGLISAGIFGWI